MDSSAHIVYVQMSKPTEGVTVYAEMSAEAYSATREYNVGDLFTGVASKRYSRSYLEKRFTENTKLNAAMSKIRHLERKLFIAERIFRDIADNSELPDILIEKTEAYIADVEEYKSLHMTNRNKMLPQEFTYELDENGGIPPNFMHTHIEWAGSAKTAYNQARLHFSNLAEAGVQGSFLLPSKRYYVYTHKVYESEDAALADLRTCNDFYPRRQAIGCYIIQGGGYLFFLPESARTLG